MEGRGLGVKRTRSTAFANLGAASRSRIHRGRPSRLCRPSSMKPGGSVSRPTALANLKTVPEYQIHCSQAAFANLGAASRSRIHRGRPGDRPSSQTRSLTSEQFQDLKFIGAKRLSPTLAQRRDPKFIAAGQETGPPGNRVRQP